MTTNELQHDFADSAPSLSQLQERMRVLRSQEMTPEQQHELQLARIAYGVASRRAFQARMKGFARR